jgi:hypothetical protein
MKTRWVAMDPASFAGRLVGDGQCVDFVRKAASGLPDTARWMRGPKARGTPLEAGTVLATFDADGRYSSAMDGSSHACVLLADLPDGLSVYDQWAGPPEHPVARRVIRAKGGVGPACDDADAYYCVETASGR